MNLILIGFMGSGKSEVAKHLSALLNYSHVEMDDLVFAWTKSQNMDQVFSKGGELLLRETEIAIAKECASKEKLVVSTGGGAILNTIIFDYFKSKRGKVIFLNTSFELISKRLELDQTRPLFKNRSTAQDLYNLRLPLYLHYADLVIDTHHRTPLQIGEEIFHGL